MVMGPGEVLAYLAGELCLRWLWPEQLTCLSGPCKSAFLTGLAPATQPWFMKVPSWRGWLEYLVPKDGTACQPGIESRRELLPLIHRREAIWTWGQQE